MLFAERGVALVEVESLWCGQDDPAAQFLALDVAVTCRVADVTAVIRMSQAHRLQELPDTLRGLRGQVLTVGQALVLLKETEGLAQDLVRGLDRDVQPRILGLTANASQD